MTRRAILTCCAVVLVLGAASLTGQTRPPTTGPQNPPLIISSLDGHDLYNFYCASCHGRNGLGDGPTAPALKTRPADLTALARKNGGVFPNAQVGVLLSGPRRAIPAHGSAEMPVWGPIFRALDPKDNLTAVRIANLVTFLESIQLR